MSLTDPQKEAVRQWAAAGATLSQIQTRLAEELGVRMSFIDVRLMVLELQVAIREKRVPEAPKPVPPAPAPAPVPEDEEEEETELSDEELQELDKLDAPPEPPTGANVTVEVNRLTQPGFALTGDVTFSDGVKAQWGITTRGELSLAAADPTYRPTPEDVRDFQTKLRSAISRQGL